ncbi:MAG: type I 3-dehydroquinate dehydratase [Euryarchaeota archaeon]|nr:type I 3-dehydroquinate dehydratase [Euryarchaeota archaeon]
MTLLVESVKQKTARRTVSVAQRARGDLVEIRLDAISGLTDEGVAAIRGSLRKPLVATLRPKGHGGDSVLPEPERMRLLYKAANAGFEWVDLEYETAQLTKRIKRIHEAGAAVIVSAHSLRGTPPARRILVGLRRAVRAGADVVKYASLVKTDDARLRLVDCIAGARREGIPVAVMGLGDASLRAAAPLMGQALVYCRSTGSAAAAGQLPAQEMRAHLAAAKRPTTPATKLLLLIGSPVSHSLSPAIQNAAIDGAGLDARYLAYDADQVELSSLFAVLHGANILGANITAPYKERAALLPDELTEAARLTNSVNCLRNDSGRLIGHTTDGEGAVRALERAGVGLEGAKAVVLGAGGSGRSVSLALTRSGAKVTLLNRTAKSATDLRSRLGLHGAGGLELAEKTLRDTDVLVNCASPAPDGAPLFDYAAIHSKLTVLDAVYSPPVTPLLAAAKKRRANVVKGTEMLLEQGILSFQFWFDRPAPRALMRFAMLEASVR